MRPAREASWRDDSAACSMMSSVGKLATGVCVAVSDIGEERSAPEGEVTDYRNVSGRLRKPRSACTGL